MSLITDWMSFSADGLIPLYRRNGDMAEIQIRWVGDLKADRNEAFVDAIKATSKDVSRVVPAGLPEATIHQFQPEAMVKQDPISGDWYGTVLWRRFLGPISGWSS